MRQGSCLSCSSITRIDLNSVLTSAQRSASREPRLSFPQVGQTCVCSDFRIPRPRQVGPGDLTSCLSHNSRTRLRSPPEISPVKTRRRATAPLNLEQHSNARNGIWRPLPLECMVSASTARAARHAPVTRAWRADRPNARAQRAGGGPLLSRSAAMSQRPSGPLRNASTKRPPPAVVG
jgi:hypothetical protein